MQKNIYSVFQVLIILITALYGSALAMDIGPVRQVYSISHAVNVPSPNPYIQIKWLSPENGLADGYYVTFSTKMTHVFDEFNTADNDVELIRNETQVTSQDFSGADDVNYYCHIAAFALDTNDKEFIGPTVSEGPFRVDTIAPLNPVVNAPSAVRERMITIQPGAYHATEMYISNAGYELNGQWETFAQKRQWELRDIQGSQIIYVVFRDLAGNTVKASAAVRYDTIGPIPEFHTAASMPARSSPITISIVFNEPVTQFSDTDIQTSNCEIQNFVSDQSELSARFFVECIPFTQGHIQLSIMENVLQDEAGNANQASKPFEWIYDTSLPEIQSIADQMIIENAGSKSIAFSITNSHAFNGVLTIDAWADQSTLVDTQGLVINSQGNPFDTTLIAGASQTLSLEMTPRPDQSGETLIHLMVSDATGMTAHTAFQLNVWDAPNISPIPDLQMEESTSYSIAIVLTDVYKKNLDLSMTSSSPSLMGPDHMTLIGDAIFNSTSFPYSILPANSEMSAIKLDLYFEPPKNKHGSVNLTLTATNIKNLSQTRAFKLDILPVNDLPVLVMDTTVRSFEDQTVQVPVSITDIDQDELVVNALTSNETLIPKNLIRWIRNGTEYFNPISVPLQTSMTQDLILKLSPAGDDYGDATITVRVEDKGGVTEKVFQLTILPVNDPPVSPETMSFTINENVPSGTKVGKISVSDVDNPSLTFTMIDISPLNHFQLYPSTGDIIVNGNIDFETASLYNLTVQVSDTYSKSTTRVNIHVANMNDHSPQLEDNFHIDVQENTAIGTIIKTIAASDIDNDPLSYTLTFQTATTPFAISRHTGEIWINDTVDYESQSLYVSTITVSDGVHQEERPLTITVADINEAPAISGIPALTVVQGQEYYFKPITYDPDTNDQLFFYISGEPQWADLDEETGKLYGIPKNEHVGVWKNVSISVRDKSNLSASLPSYNITVINANDPPELKKIIDNVSVDKNTSFAYTILQDTFIDPDIGDVLTYQATELNKDQLPAWLAFDSVTRHFSGTPGNFDGGVYIIQVTALDSFLTATATSFLLTVIDHNIVPQITLPSPKIDFYENNNAAHIDKSASVEDKDSLNFDQGVLNAYFDKNGTPDDHLQIKDYGSGNLPVNLDKNKVFSGNQLIGTFSGGTYPEPLAVTFTHWANVEIVTSLLRNIMFINDSENPVDNERRLAVTISDGDGGTSEPVYKTIRVHATNDDPILSIGDQIIDKTFSLPDINENETIIFENDRRITIDDKDSGDGVLTVTISVNKGIITFDPNNIDNLKYISDNNASNVTFSGTLEQINAGLNALRYKSNINSIGKEAIQLNMKDNGYSGFGGGEYVDCTISFQINGIDEPPQFSTIPLQIIMEDTPAKIAFSITETDFQKVTIRPNDYQVNMIYKDSLTFEGPLVEENLIINTLANDHADLTLNVMPRLNQTGNTYIILVLYDGVNTVSTKIDLYITPINDPPAIDNQWKTIYEDAPMPLSLSVTDSEEDALQLSLVTPPEHGTVTLDSFKKQFIYTPQKDNTKSVFFEYCAYDDEFQSNIGRVDISIIPVNDPPQIESVSNQTLLGLQTRTITFSVSDVDSIDINVSAESNNTQIFPNNQANISLIPNNNHMYTLYLNPMKDQFGTTTITINARDSLNASASQSFVVYVKQLDNTGPVISLYSPQVVQIDQNGEYIEPGYFAIDDIDGDVTESVTIQNNINTQLPGIYHITYHVEDAAGNHSEPAERMVIVNKNQFTSQKISGNIYDDTGGKVGFVKIIVEGQGHTYTSKVNYEGYFELEIPITFDGSVWLMHLEREDYYSQTLAFFSPQSFETITMFSKNSNNAEVIKGQCYSHQVDGTNMVLPQVSIRVISIENDAVLATSISDDKGQYTLAVDIRDRPYTFEAAKYGYETKSFDSNSASTIVLMPVTTIFVEQPESTTDHHIADNYDRVTLFVSANPPFTKVNTELSVNLVTGEKLLLKKPVYVNNKYQIEYGRYADFAIIIRADTTDDRNVDSDYYVEQTLFFKSIEGSSEVYVTKGEAPYSITQSFYIEQSDLSSSFMWIDRGGLSGLDTPRELNYTIRNYTFPFDDNLYDHVVEFELKDSFGRDISMVDQPICLGIEFAPPVTRDSLDNQTYELIWAETVSDLLMGQVHVESSFTLFDRYVTFCTSHLSAFGFRKSEGTSQKSVAGDDSGGGCFLMSMPLPGK